MAGKPGRPPKWTQRNRQNIAERLNAGKALKVLHEVDEIMADHWTDVTPAQVQANRLRAEMAHFTLDKIIPSPKQVELSGQVTVTEFRLKADPK